MKRGGGKGGRSKIKEDVKVELQTGKYNTSFYFYNNITLGEFNERHLEQDLVKE